MRRVKNDILHAMALEAAWFAEDEDDITSWKPSGCPSLRRLGRQQALEAVGMTAEGLARHCPIELEVTVHVRPDDEVASAGAYMYRSEPSDPSGDDPDAPRASRIFG